MVRWGDVHSSVKSKHIGVPLFNVDRESILPEVDITQYAKLWILHTVWNETPTMTRRTGYGLPVFSQNQISNVLPRLGVSDSRKRSATDAAE
jgi:hypothetical protein